MLFLDKFHSRVCSNEQNVFSRSEKFRGNFRHHQKDLWPKYAIGKALGEPELLLVVLIVFALTKKYHKEVIF